MRVVQSFRAQAEAQGKELLRSVEAAETVIVSTIERECEALRAGQMLAANALRIRLRDAASLYLNVIRAARASIWTLEQVLPGTRSSLEARRLAFASLLKVELAVLSAERTVAESELQFAAAKRARAPAVHPQTRPTRRRRIRLRRAG
jgi:vacuolar-type H+-ATPase subunit I/STV1